MAKSLKPCRGCEHPVASSAKSCPKCGASNPVTSTGEYIGATVLLAVIGAVVWFACFDGSLSDPRPSTTTRPPSHARELAEKCFSAWDGNHPDLVKQVKDQLHDPASMDVHGTYFSENDSLTDGKIRIRMDYSAANQLGGMTRNNAMADLNETCGITIIQYE